MKKLLSLIFAVGLILLSGPVRAVSATGFGVSNPTAAPLAVEIKQTGASPTPLPVQGTISVVPGPTDSAGVPYTHPTYQPALPTPIPDSTSAPHPILVDGVKTTASSLGAGGSGAIGWLSHMSDALHNVLHVIVDSGSVVLGAGSAVIGHVVTDTGSVVNATLQASSAVIGHVIVDSGTVILGAGAATIGSIANTTFAVTQATGSNLHAVLDASSAAIGHVIVDSGTLVIGAGASVIGAVTQSGTWTVGVNNFPATQPVSIATTIPVSVTAADPCGNPTTTYYINLVNASGETKIISKQTGKVIYVCSADLQGTGTAPTLQWTTGTRTTTDCDTGVFAVGPQWSLLVSSGVENAGRGNHPFVQSGVSQDLCLLLGGTTPGVQGQLQYVVQ